MISNMDSYENVSMEFISDLFLSLEDDYLTYLIANNYNAPKKVLKKLMKHSDPDISSVAKNNLE